MYRIGQGYDLHRLEAGRPLILGGITIPHEKGCVAHSDGDALAHAITDALLGALCLGDIGALFPDTDPNYAGANSLDLLREAHALVTARGYAIVNLDTTIVAQRPKLRPYVDSIRQALAATLSLSVEQISVKAKTKEHVGPEGREEAISTQAIVLLLRESGGTQD
ncbi:MAG: 2-C-methyl-D-erythritol 2,4-cyclodiphosphate synthase [Candidatus Hydrogenedentes bacterium]|nr:2-C-methyl-D-erythritol 2,4-cyclodiphosphate synthase [Candidatus Hydrogenedentota bacterium]